MMDAAAAVDSALDGVRSVAAKAAEVIFEHAEGDRCQFVAAAEVETAANAALGVSAGSDDAVTAGETSRFGGFLQQLNALPRLVAGLGKRASTDVTGGEGAGASTTSSDAASDAASADHNEDDSDFKAAIEAAQLTPVTDVIVVQSGDPLPSGFSRIEWSATGLYPADLNAVRTAHGGHVQTSARFSCSPCHARHPSPHCSHLARGKCGLPLLAKRARLPSRTSVS